MGADHAGVVAADRRRLLAAPVKGWDDPCPQRGPRNRPCPTRQPEKAEAAQMVATAMEGGDWLPVPLRAPSQQEVAGRQLAQAA